MIVKKVRRRVFNFKKFFCFLLFLVALIIGFYYLQKVPIKNIVIKGNAYLSDEEIIETADIEEYPSFIMTLSSTIKRKISKLSLVKEVNVKKKWGFVLEIDITEYKVLFSIRSTNEYMLDNEEKVSEIDYKNEIPILINYVPDDKLSKFVNKLNTVEYETIMKISEIEYTPTEYDPERFLFYMRDGNHVYVTLTKIKEFGNYSKIKNQLGTKKGILYLDSGNYFEIKE